MKLFRMFTLAAVTACLVTASAFAAPTSDLSGMTALKQRENNATAKGKKDHKEFRNKGFKCKDGTDMQRDPIKMMKARKEKVQFLLKEGKITEERANDIITNIDERIKEVEEYNKLPIQQKKDKLTKRVKASIEERVKDGKLTRKKADVLMKNFMEKLKDWDGSGFPPFLREGFKHGKKQKSDSLK